jgi:acetylornithine deacetylase/succinyl-diaminopimelate desuccinylase-like protein
MAVDWNQAKEEATQIPTVLEPRPDRANLICCLKGTEAEPPIILLHHIDVVPAEADKWRQRPYSGAVIEGEIWGRGAQDCKSLGVMELVALLLLKREGFRPRRNIVYLATADEEAGGKWGVDWLFQNHPERMKAGFVINEGGGLGMVMGAKHVYTCQTAEKGICWMKLTFRGQPGHGSIPRDDNCIVRMAQAIERISSHRSSLRRTPTTIHFIRGIAAEQVFPRSFLIKQLLNRILSSAVQKRLPDQGLRDMAGAILRNTFVPTVVQGGQKTNVIPSECSCQIDCRILPGVDPEMVKAELRSLLSDFKNYELEILQAHSASESPVDSPLYQTFEKTLKRLDQKSKMIPFMQTGATDSRFFRLTGAMAYGFQPMVPTDSLAEYLSRVHGHDERISTESLLFGTQVLYEVLKDFCG